MAFPQLENWLAERTGLGGAELKQVQGIFTAGYLDSFDLVELVVLLEQTMGRRIPAIDLVPHNFDSLDKIETYLTSSTGR